MKKLKLQKEQKGMQTDSNKFIQTQRSKYRDLQDINAEIDIYRKDYMQMSSEMEIMNDHIIKM